MDPAWVIDRLESNASVFQGQLRLVRSPQAMWKPASDEWSILEVVNHLAEEETDDFRLRLRFLIEDPTREWPAIDPERSVWTVSSILVIFESRLIALRGNARGLWIGCARFRPWTGGPCTMIPNLERSEPAICSVRGWRTI
jgi:hypothetical protein